MPFADLIRSGSEQGLLRSGWPVWKGYREMRGKTSPAYDEGTAVEVAAGIPDFLEEASYLLDQLHLRVNGPGGKSV